MPNSLALDANLLVLLIVGQVDRSWIGRHRRLRNYGVGDFDLLTKLVSGSRSLIITPNVATEVANLVVYGVDDPLRAQFLCVLGVISESTDERYRKTRDVAGRAEFARLGLTDAVWLSVLDSSSTLLTDDTDLFLAALANGLDAVRFADLRAHSS